MGGRHVGEVRTVEPGQTWKHVRSGDIRIVHDLYDDGRMRYARLVSVTRSGILVRDCRDSSDMPVTKDARPKYPNEWEFMK